MPFEVKVPQLGMNQDSAVIVTWVKTAGDAVAEGDVLFEVETDKATMEVEAQAAGYLAGIRAREGDDVPVGDVIALIVESADEVGARAEAAPVVEAPDQVRGAAGEADAEAETKASPAPEPEPATEPAAAPAPASASILAPRPLPAPMTGKVLASPKARRLAAERGIDLAALRAQGVAEPIHAADLSKASTGGQSTLTATADGTALDALLAKAGDHANRAHLLAAFAAGAWRALFGAEDVGIAIRHLDGSSETLSNPDRGGTGEAAPALQLIDLCNTRLSGYAPATGPALTVARAGDGYALSLTVSEATLPMPHAVALLDDIAARIDDPIRQFL